MTMWEDLGPKAILALGTTTGEINKSSDALTKMTSLNGADFGATMEGLKRQMITGIVLPIGEEVLPKLKDFQSSLSESTPQAVATVTPILNGLISVFEFLIRNLDEILPILADVLLGITAYKVVTEISILLKAFQLATVGATTVTELFNIALASNPIGVVIVSLAALGLAIYELVKHWDAITAAIKRAWDWLTNWNGTPAKDKNATVTTKYYNDDGSLKMLPSHAQGTNFFAGGLTSINEMGGEIVDLPRGTRIIPHDISMQMAKESKGTTTTNVINNSFPITQLIVREEADVNKIAQKLYNLQRRDLRGQGVTV